MKEYMWKVWFSKHSINISYNYCIIIYKHLQYFK